MQPPRFFFRKLQINKTQPAAYTVEVKYLLFTGGGSAGHVTPNLAVMQKLRGKYRLAYMGTGGIEKALLAPFGCPYYLVECPKLVRSLTPKNLTLPFRLRTAQKAALAVLERETPDLVFSKGGYASYPAVWAAAKLGVPVLTHESDLTPGLCTRLVAKKCTRVLTSFPETASRFANGVCVGSPIRSELFGKPRDRARKKYGFRGEKPVLLVLGGIFSSFICKTFHELGHILFGLCCGFRFNSVRIGFMSASSYGAGVFSSGEVKLGGLSFPVEGKNILIVEDIIDTGNSLCALKRFLTERGAASVKICAFLDKESRRTADVAVDFVGYAIEDEFVVGYGLDYAERYRGLPYIGILKREVYEK